MLNGAGGREDHEKFKEACALAAAGSLTPVEVAELQAHLPVCEECRELLRQYRLLTTEGLPVLADAYHEGPVAEAWNGHAARQNLLSRVEAEGQEVLQPVAADYTGRPPGLLRKAWSSSPVRLALAAGIILGVVSSAYHLGRHLQARSMAVEAPLAGPPSTLITDEKHAAERLLAEQERKLSELQQVNAQKEQELEKLRVALRGVEDRASTLAAANTESAERLEALGQQRDALNIQLQAATLAYDKNKTELATLQGERDRTVLRMASLEVRINELTATNRDQERRLKDAEQFLSSDRDIRELMGARKLYIADVFDVDGSSRTQKPYGRVFYTQGKSLIFYAFDLDHQPKVINASTFQVWGQREAPAGEQGAPLNLGILYMDSEANRRWVMRFDDPRQLAEIDAVFVTVEPRGGSQKPTSKPFLYALLRNEANHP